MLAQVVPGLVSPYSAELWPKTSFISFVTASALSCYVCNSNENYEGKDCNDDTKLEQFLLDCAEYAERYGRPEFKNSTMCRKQEQTGKKEEIK